MGTGIIRQQSKFVHNRKKKCFSVIRKKLNCFLNIAYNMVMLCAMPLKDIIIINALEHKPNTIPHLKYHKKSFFLTFREKKYHYLIGDLYNCKL